MTTIACVLRSGGIYTQEHTTRLRNMLRSASFAQRFVCLSDVAVDDWERVPLITGLPGYWSKIELFRPNLFQGRVLYLDLDVTVVGDLAEIAQYPYGFCAVRDYQFPIAINSSVMAWDAGTADHVFTEFTPAVMDRLHGDQSWIHAKMPAMTFPKRWCPSYKLHVRPTGRVPDDARVVVHHGRPKPWEIE